MSKSIFQALRLVSDRLGPLANEMDADTALETLTDEALGRILGAVASSMGFGTWEAAVLSAAADRLTGRDPAEGLPTQEADHRTLSPGAFREYVEAEYRTAFAPTREGRYTSAYVPPSEEAVEAFLTHYLPDLYAAHWSVEAAAVEMWRCMNAEALPRQPIDTGDR